MRRTRGTRQAKRQADGNGPQISSKLSSFTSPRLCTGLPLEDLDEGRAEGAPEGQEGVDWRYGSVEDLDASEWQVHMCVGRVALLLWSVQLVLHAKYVDWMIR